MEKKLKEAFDLVADSLIAAGYPERIQCAYELVDANESAIAFEIMCSNLSEFDCHISTKAYELLAEVGGNLNGASQQVISGIVIDSSQRMVW
jgi:hypothetical protein